jgi:hypothetical protein
MIAGSDGLVDIGSLSRKLGVLYQSFRFVPFLVRCFPHVYCSAVTPAIRI